MKCRLCFSSARKARPLVAMMIPFCTLLLLATRIQAFVADPEGTWLRESSSPPTSRSSIPPLLRRWGGASPTSSSSTMLSIALSASMESMDPIRQRPTATSKSPVTETATPLPEPDKLPVNHKIVVLGATGRVGRLVVRQLLEESPDGTQVVAVVRDYDKACRVLYDDLIVTKHDRRIPKLQIVATELVSRSEMPAAPAAAEDDEEDDEMHAAWLKRAQAAATFYGTKVTDYDDGRVTDEDNAYALEQIIQGCTAVVSCVGSVRTSKPWQDWRLTRLLRKDVRKWCADESHPYYTQFHTTRKVLHLAEREQERRNVLFQAQDDADENKEANTELLTRRRDKNAPPRRIRFVRLSDLAVTQKPWHLVPLLTNTMRSMVFRYHEMADDLLIQSRLLDTVVVRAGELVDEERDVDEVGVQVNVDEYQILNATTGRVVRASGGAVRQGEGNDQNGVPSCDWSPSRVGREDVAALLSASVLAPWLSEAADNQTESATSSVHYTLATRWSGDAKAMAPYPPQGTKTDGCRTAAKSLQKAVRKTQRQSSTVAKTARSKPYGVCVAVPLYLMMALLLRNLSKTLWLASQGTKVMGAVALLPNLRPLWQLMIRVILRRTPAVEYISF
eukprot:scaffold158_cov141-Amphora_coffeaeformis.AAC.3